MRISRPLIHLACSVSLVVAATSCGSDSGSNATNTDATTSEATSAPETTAPAPTTTALVPALRPETPLDGGTTYRLGASVLGQQILYTVAVDGSFGFTTRGYFGATLDKIGTEVLVNIVDLSIARVFTNPAVDLSSLQSDSAFQGATEPAPADFLAYFAALPAVTAGPIQTTEFAGFPAKSMKYSTGIVDGAFPCFSVDRGPCLLTIYVPVSVAVSYWNGDSSTLYLVTIDGRNVLIDVSDREGAAETAASIVIDN